MGIVGTGIIGFDSSIAGSDHSSYRVMPICKRFTVGVEQAVVHTEVRGIVGGVHCIADIVADTHFPAEIMRPVSGVCTTDIGGGTGIAFSAQQGFAKTGIVGGSVELARQAAVANHEGGTVEVGHLRGVFSREIGLRPAVVESMGTVVDQPTAFAVHPDEDIGRGRGLAATRDGNTCGGKRDIVLIVTYIGKAVARIDIGAGSIIHGRVGIAVSIVGSIALVYAGYEDCCAQIAVVGEGITLVEDGFLSLGKEFGHCAGRETTIIAVGDMITFGPSGIVQVCHMVVGRARATRRESRNLSMVAH